MYSTPEMTDYAWAVPRCVVDCSYIIDENREKVERFRKMGDNSTDIWSTREFAQIPVDAQSGELIIAAVPTEEICRVPEIVTWDDV